MPACASAAFQPSPRQIPKGWALPFPHTRGFPCAFDPLPPCRPSPCPQSSWRDAPAPAPEADTGARPTRRPPTSALAAAPRAKASDSVNIDGDLGSGVHRRHSTPPLDINELERTVVDKGRAETRSRPVTTSRYALSAFRAEPVSARIPRHVESATLPAADSGQTAHRAASSAARHRLAFTATSLATDSHAGQVYVFDFLGVCRPPRGARIRLPLRGCRPSSCRRRRSDDHASREGMLPTEVPARGAQEG